MLPPSSPPSSTSLTLTLTSPSRGTTLIIADHVLPLAYVDDFSSKKDDVVEGVERMLALPPFLVNLGQQVLMLTIWIQPMCVYLHLHNTSVNHISCFFFLVADASNIQFKRTNPL